MFSFKRAVMCSALCVVLAVSLVFSPFYSAKRADAVAFAAAPAAAAVFAACTGVSLAAVYACSPGDDGQLADAVNDMCNNLMSFGYGVYNQFNALCNAYVESKTLDIDPYLRTELLRFASEYYPDSGVSRVLPGDASIVWDYPFYENNYASVYSWDDLNALPSSVKPSWKGVSHDFTQQELTNAFSYVDYFYSHAFLSRYKSEYDSGSSYDYRFCLALYIDSDGVVDESHFFVASKGVHFAFDAGFSDLYFVAPAGSMGCVYNLQRNYGQDRYNHVNVLEDWALDETFAPYAMNTIPLDGDYNQARSIESARSYFDVDDQQSFVYIVSDAADIPVYNESISYDYDAYFESDLTTDHNVHVAKPVFVSGTPSAIRDYVSSGSGDRLQADAAADSVFDDSFEVVVPETPVQDWTYSEVTNGSVHADSGSSSGDYSGVLGSILDMVGSLPSIEDMLETFPAALQDIRAGLETLPADMGSVFEGYLPTPEDVRDIRDSLETLPESLITIEDALEYVPGYLSDIFEHLVWAEESALQIAVQDSEFHPVVIQSLDSILSQSQQASADAAAFWRSVQSQISSLNDSASAAVDALDAVAVSVSPETWNGSLAALTVSPDEDDQEQLGIFFNPMIETVNNAGLALQGVMASSVEQSTGVLSQAIPEAALDAAEVVTTALDASAAKFYEPVNEISQAVEGAGNFVNNPDYDDCDWKDVLDEFGRFKLVFPLCIPFDIVDLIETLNGTPQAPSFTVPNGLHTLTSYSSYDLDLSSWGMDSVMSKVRAVELVLFGIGLIMITRYVVRG